MIKIKAPKLRSYQVALNEPTKKFLFKDKKNHRAQIYAPTGAGKTVCFNDLIREAINKGMTNIAIVHPRIALSQDQLKRFQTMFGSSVHTTSFHSGKHLVSENIGSISGVNTTNVNELSKIIRESKTVLSLPHVTFSSYHSFDKLDAIKFDMIICDEAHYLAQDRFSEYLVTMNAGKILFYTATPITAEMVDDDTKVMGNVKLFGEVIAQVAPKELIKMGYIVAPLVHMLECTTGTKNDSKVDVVDLVAKSYAQQFIDVKKNGMPFVQMLVAARNVAEDLVELNTRANEVQKKIKKELGSLAPTEFVNIYTISSGEVYKNGKPFSGERFAALAEIKSGRQNCIIAHYDTLAEGIDIDTLTGVVLMRSLSKAKMIQTIGRCARPFMEDLDSKTFEPRKDLFDLENHIDIRKKPRCIVTLPTVNGKWIANDDGRAIAEAFIVAGYDELTTYLSSNGDDATGKKRIDPFFQDDEDTLMAAITSSKLDRELEDLRKLFDFS